MNISKVSLDEVFWFQEGPGVRNWQFQKEGIKLLNVANIEKNGQLNLGKTDRYLAPDEANGKYAHFLLDEGDLVIASSGMSFDTDGMLRTRGAFVEREHLPLCLNTSTIRFKPKDGRSDLKFLRHWLDGSEFRGQITKLVTGSAQQNFGPTHLKALRISVPPLEEQRRIAAILDQAETLRTQRRTALALLDSLTQSLFLDMFGDPVRGDGRYSVQAVETIASEERYSIVDGPFGSAIKQSDYLDTGIPVIRIGNLTKDGYYSSSNLLYIGRTLFESLKRSNVLPGDVLISRVGTLGNTCIYPPDAGEALLSTTGVCKIKVNTKVMLAEYLHAAIRCPSFQEQIQKSASTSVQKYFNLSALKSWQIVVPPLPLQQTFATRIAAIEALKATHRRALAALDALFASLQQRAFTGAL